MPETYRSPHAGTIADLIRQRGQVGARTAMAVGNAEANRAATSGQAWGNAIGNIAQGVSGTLADFAQQREQAPLMALRQKQADQLAQELSAMETAQAQKKIGELAAMVKASGYDPNAAEPVFSAIAKLSPEYAEPLQRSLMEPGLLKNVTDTLISQTPGYKAPEGFSLSEGQTRFGPDGTPIANVPKPPPVEQPFTLGEGQVRYNPDGTQVAAGPPKTATPVSLRVEDVLIDGKPAKAVFNPQTGVFSVGGQDVTARVRPIPSSSGTGPEKPSVWVSKGSDMRFVTPTEASALSREGWRSGQAREQGRPVASGDANRVADLDTSLDDVDVLGQTLTETKDATGVAAQIGASLPNWATNMTGWGTDAKKRQGVIDRVKQVIGKALEGGVLRKEDEIKYAKILPTIGDPPEVAASKLVGLKEALVQRRQTLLDALEDSGYDTSRFNARQPAPKDDADAKVDALIKKYGGG